MSDPAGTFGGVLLPSTCPICLAVGPAPCAACIAQLRPAPDLDPPPGVDRCLALMAYEGTGAVLVQRLKYANHRDALDTLALGLARLLAPEQPTVLTWVPAAPDHRRHRGFDQGELLARAVSRHLPGAGARRLLDRRAGPAQTGRDRAHRLVGPDLVARRSVPTAGPIALLDDVRTTGASLAAAAAALRSAGANSIVCATIAATPDHVPT
jgi:predicted amidophosphoribosyltransferase